MVTAEGAGEGMTLWGKLRADEVREGVGSERGPDQEDGRQRDKDAARYQLGAGGDADTGRISSRNAGTPRTRHHVLLGSDRGCGAGDATSPEDRPVPYFAARSRRRTIA